MEANIKTGKQGGYALLIMLLALMAMAGIGVASFTKDMKQEAVNEKFLHNQRVLREAKQALLQYAYRYPQFNSEGPGRLPCPDTNDDGQPGDGGPIDTLACTSVGRFPWDETEMNFYDARDADRERLWYAVSVNFYNLGGGGAINSDTLGTISMHDRSGSLMHDASQDQSGTRHQGIAAVIIAPGAVIDRAGVTQDRSDDADPNDPANYLDLFANGIDNASFVNSTTGGFVLGPIEDTDSGNLLVNDQIIIVTAAEVIEMAEKATLNAYRESILAYLAATGGQYPWLYNYNGITYTYDPDDPDAIDEAVDLLNTHFPTESNFTNEKDDYLDDNGRIPSIFGNYFVEDSSGDSGIETDLDVTINFTIPTSIRDVEGKDWWFNSSQPFLLTFETGFLTNVRFQDIGTAYDDIGRLSFKVPSGGNGYFPDDGSKDIFYWDEDETDPTGIWTHCTDGGDGDAVIDDCHRDKDQYPDPEGPNESKEEILKLVIQYYLPDTDDVPQSIDFNYATPPAITIEPATADQHARITATFNGAGVVASSLSLNGRRLWDDHYHDDGKKVEKFEPKSNINFDTDALTVNSMTISMRYFPQLPRWVETNEWHNSIRMAYAPDYRPDAAGLGLTPPCSLGDNDCLRINETEGGPLDIVSLLVIAREHGWVDNSGDGDLDVHDLTSVFDDGNHNGNYTYYTRRGNDRVMVVEELP